MIIESDNSVLLLKQEDFEVIKAIPSTFVENEWIIITEEENGDTYVGRTMTETELADEYGEIPK